MTNRILKLAALSARLLPPALRQRLYRLGPVSRWIRGVLNRAAPGGLTEIDVAAGALAGLRMELDLQREKDYWLGSYEPHLLKALAGYVGEGMTVYDVGANIGYITLMLAGAVGKKGQVFAFEALPDNVRRLETHIRINHFTDRITVTHAAVVDRPGPVDFLVHASHGMGKAAGSAGRDENYPESIRVPGISIDDFVYEHGRPAPDVLKLDIEGGEALALAGMRRTLTAIQPVLFIELHGRRAAEATWERLAEAGYSLHRMRGSYPAVQNPDELDWKAYVLALPGERS